MVKRCAALASPGRVSGAASILCTTGAWRLTSGVGTGLKMTGSVPAVRTDASRVGAYRKRPSSATGSSPERPPTCYSAQRSAELGSGHPLGTWGHLHWLAHTGDDARPRRRPHSFSVESGCCGRADVSRYRNAEHHGTLRRRIAQQTGHTLAIAPNPKIFPSHPPAVWIAGEPFIWGIPVE
jgi:hypothetical protein